MDFKFPMFERLTATNPPGLRGSKDPETGRVYYPARHFSDDGALRETEEVVLSNRGTLYSFSEFRGVSFGHIDLPEGVRIPAVLDEGPHQQGEEYVFELLDREKGQWRFRRA